MTAITQMNKFNVMFYNTLLELAQDDQSNGLLSDDWEGQFKSDSDFQILEKLLTFTYRNIKVCLLTKLYTSKYFIKL